MAADSKPQEVAIRGDYIELAQLLKFSGLVETGGEAKQVIGAGQVELNGAVETQRGKKVVPGDRVRYDGQTLLVRGS
ncbi:MAG TPA: RNA-binding S4 domain-containing protein [Acidobacteriota bacterium]|nr:RNA-binding S4 domain-containing protein [Acidobacteriota bacterium]